MRFRAKGKHLYWKIRNFFFPQNRWATKVIPSHFTDVDWIIEEVAMAGLVFYWEQDDGEKSLRQQAELEVSAYYSADEKLKREQVYQDMLVCYNSIKQGHLNLLAFRTRRREIVDLIVKHRLYLWS